MVKNLWSAWPSQGVRHEINSVQDTESLESLLEIPLTQIWDSDSIWDFFIDLSKYSVIQNPKISNDIQFSCQGKIPASQEAYKIPIHAESL